MGRPKLYTSVEKMEKDIKNYFINCDKNKIPYTMSGLAYSLDMDRKSLLNYSKDEKFFHTIKKAREKVEQQLEENALMGKANSTFTIFNLKNNFNWKDAVEVDNSNAINKLDEILREIKDEANNN